MSVTDTETARSIFEHGEEVEVVFFRQNDNRPKAGNGRKLIYVDLWRVKYGDEKFTINLILPSNAPSGARWLIGSIQNSNNKSVWSFRDDFRVLHRGFHGSVYPVSYNGVTCLVYQTKEREPRVAFTVPLCDLLQKQEPQRPLTEVIERKRGIADMLQFGVMSTETEDKVIKAQARKRRLADEAEKEQKHRQKKADRHAKVHEMLHRTKITVLSNGRRVTGVPVSGDEWMVLPARKVVVSGYVDDDGRFVPKETFRVFRKPGQKAQKHHPSPVTEEVADLPQHTTIEVVEVDGQPFDVPTFKSEEDVEKHRLNGLNSGALRGVEKGGQFFLFQVTKEKLVPVENYERL